MDQRLEILKTSLAWTMNEFLWLLIGNNGFNETFTPVVKTRRVISSGFVNSWRENPTAVERKKTSFPNTQEAKDHRQLEVMIRDAVDVRGEIELSKNPSSLKGVNRPIKKTSALRWFLKYEKTIVPLRHYPASETDYFKNIVKTFQQSEAEKSEPPAKETAAKAGKKHTTGRRSNIHRDQCRTIAKISWEKSPTTTIADMIVCDEITRDGCDGKVYSENTVRDWVKDLCPDRSPGKRPKG